MSNYICRLLFAPFIVRTDRVSALGNPIVVLPVSETEKFENHCKSR